MNATAIALGQPPILRAVFEASLDDLNVVDLVARQWDRLGRLGLVSKTWRHEALLCDQDLLHLRLTDEDAVKRLQEKAASGQVIRQLSLHIRSSATMRALALSSDSYDDARASAFCRQLSSYTGVHCLALDFGDSHPSGYQRDLCAIDWVDAVSDIPVNFLQQLTALSLTFLPVKLIDAVRSLPKATRLFVLDTLDWEQAHMRALEETCSDAAIELTWCCLDGHRLPGRATLASYLERRRFVDGGLFRRRTEEDFYEAWLRNASGVAA